MENQWPFCRSHAFFFYFIYAELQLILLLKLGQEKGWRMFSIFQFYVCGCIIGYCLATKILGIESFKVIHFKRKERKQATGIIYFIMHMCILLRVKKGVREGFFYFISFFFSFLKRI